MSSVFNEKEKFKLSRGETRKIYTLYNEGYSARKISKQTGYPESLILKTLKLETRGTKTKAKRIPQADAVNAYIAVIDQKKKELKKELPKDAPITSIDIIKALGGMEKIHDATLEYLRERGWKISMRTLRNRYSKIRNFEREVLDKTQILEKVELPQLEIESQNEWEKIFDDPMWQPRKSSTKKTIAQHLRELYEIIALKNGKWKGVDKDTVKDVRKLAEVFSTAKEKPVCVKPKPIPFNQWKMGDVMWALEYIDWVTKRARFRYMVAFNRLLASNPQLESKSDLRRFSKQTGITCSKERWGRTTFPKEFPHLSPAAEVPKEIADLMKQPPKVGMFKVVPEQKELKKVLDEIDKMKKLHSTAFNKLKGKDGKVIELPAKVKRELEKDAVKLAVAISCATGLRAGHSRETELGSLRFGNIMFKANEIHCATKMSEGEIVPIQTNSTVINQIKSYKQKLEKFGIDTSKMYIFPFRMNVVNKYLREASERAGVTKPVYIYGEKKRYPGTKKKYYIVPLPKGHHRAKKLKLVGIHRQPIYEDPEDPDMHLHLFRAFHLVECLRNDIPLDIAVGLGAGWKDIQVALKHYAARWTKEQRKKWREKEEAIFSQLF
ncbi:MAG: hypothetical protein ACTSRS_19010 [Candidatus Helarchaeota archaeon]